MHSYGENGVCGICGVAQPCSLGRQARREVAMLEKGSFYRVYCICGATDDWGIEAHGATTNDAWAAFRLRGWLVGETVGETKCPECAKRPNTQLESDTASLRAVEAPGTSRGAAQL